METATDLANRSAESFLQQGTLGATVVVLALTLAVVVFFGWREFKAERRAHDAEIAAKDLIILEMAKEWRNDIRTTGNAVTTAIDTLKSFQSGQPPPRRRGD